MTDENKLNEPKLQDPDEILIGLDERLADLMQMGWTLIAESCPLEKCHCPLLRSLDGNKYCVRCETWLFDKEPRKQKFTDLVVKGVQDLDIKELGLAKPARKKILDYSHTVKVNILNSLKLKLAYLSSILNETTDLNKSESILRNIKLCVEDIKMINESL
jgi:uncharacterized Zn finger protein (UPF0148 family)